MEINDIINDEVASIIKKISRSSGEYEKLYYHIINIKEKKEPDIYMKRLIKYLHGLTILEQCRGINLWMINL